MPRIRCNYEGCIHLEGNICTASEIELDQELGCLTFSQVDEDEVGGVEDEIEEVVEKDEEEEEWVADDLEEEDDDDLEEWEDEEDWEDEDEDDDEDGGGWPSSRSRRQR